MVTVGILLAGVVSVGNDEGVAGVVGGTFVGTWVGVFAGVGLTVGSGGITVVTGVGVGALLTRRDGCRFSVLSISG